VSRRNRARPAPRQSNYCTVTLTVVDWLTPDAPVAIIWTLYCPEGITGFVGCVGEDDPLPPQPVNANAALQTTSRSDMVWSHVRRRRRPIASRTRIPGTNTVAHRTASASLFLNGLESRRASPPVPTVSTVLAVVAPPESVIEAG
jgi:hypothetical protein